MLSFLLPHIQFVLVSNCSVSTKCMKWKLKQGWKRCRGIPKDSGASTWYNVLLVVVGVGNCADRMRGFGIPRLRLFVILAKVVHFLILLQVSAGETGRKKCCELRPAQCRERPSAGAQLLSEAWASEVLIVHRVSRFSDEWMSTSQLTGLGHSFTGGNFSVYSESRKSTSLSLEYTMSLACLQSARLNRQPFQFFISFLLNGRDSCRKLITEAVRRSRTASKCTSPDYTLVTYTMLYVLKCDEPLQITISKMWNWVTRKHKNSPFPPRGQQLVTDWKMRASLLAKSLIISKDTMTKLKII